MLFLFSLLFGHVYRGTARGAPKLEKIRATFWDSKISLNHSKELEITLKIS